MPGLTPDERNLLTKIQITTNELAKMLLVANTRGFNVTFNINGQLGTVDKFEVTRAVPVDFTAGTN